MPHRCALDRAAPARRAPGSASAARAPAAPSPACTAAPPRSRRRRGPTDRPRRLPARRRAAPTARFDSRAEWLAGCPSVIRRHALMVKANITDGRSVTLSASASASRSIGRSWPPRSRIARPRSSSSTSPSSFSTSRWPRPDPGSRSRSSSGPARSSRWYSSFGIASMRRRSIGPPSRSNSSPRRRPYLSVMVCQPAASNIEASRPAAIWGTMRSSDWRFRSTIQSTSPSCGTTGSTMASQHAPSSSSASPSSAICRPPCGTSKCPAT